MSQTPNRTTKIPVNGFNQPRQDSVTAKEQANYFPSVGMTLHSYKYDPRDHHRGANVGPTVVKSSRWKRFKGKFTFKRITIFITVILAILAIWLGGKFLYNAHKVFGGSIFGVLHSTKLKGEDQGRVNILLAGNSADDAGHNGGQLTDSIMIMSIDTKNNKAFLLSIPRDLYVKIGSSGHGKINSAYVVGEQNNFSESGYPDGGMGQLEQTIEKNLGIHSDYYALINYNALKDTVNAVGGVDIVVKSSDPRGLYDPNIDWETKGPLVRLTNGPHHLNGLQALDLSRARGDAYNSYGFPASDFDRTANQRQLLVALKTKTATSGVLANPAKLSSLSDAVGKNVKTDLGLSQVRRLFDISKLISSSNIKSLSLNQANGKNLLMSYSAPGGQSALAPAAGLDDYSDIQTFILQQTSSDPVVQEGARVVVLNGTSTDGLGSAQKPKLSQKHIRVVKVGDAATGQPTTTIIDVSQGKNPATSKLLGQMYGNHYVTTNPYVGTYDADFIVIVGADQIPKPKTTTN